MSEDPKQTHIEVLVTFSASTTLYLTEICQELEIETSDIVSLHMKYCTLYFTLKDGREIEYETTAYEAEIDTKYPDYTSTFVNVEHIATNRAYGGKIELEASQPVMYVVMLMEHGVWRPLFASHMRYKCEKFETQYLEEHGESAVIGIESVPTSQYL